MGRGARSRTRRRRGPRRGRRRRCEPCRRAPAAGLLRSAARRVPLPRTGVLGPYRRARSRGDRVGGRRRGVRPAVGRRLRGEGRRARPASSSPYRRASAWWRPRRCPRSPPRCGPTSSWCPICAPARPSWCTAAPAASARWRRRGAGPGRAGPGRRGGAPRIARTRGGGAGGTARVPPHAVSEGQGATRARRGPRPPSRGPPRGGLDARPRGRRPGGGGARAGPARPAARARGGARAGGAQDGRGGGGGGSADLPPAAPRGRRDLRWPTGRASRAAAPPSLPCAVRRAGRAARLPSRGAALLRATRGWCGTPPTTTRGASPPAGPLRRRPPPPPARAASSPSPRRFASPRPPRGERRLLQNWLLPAHASRAVPLSVTGTSRAASLAPPPSHPPGPRKTCGCSCPGILAFFPLTHRTPTTGPNETTILRGAPPGTWTGGQPAPRARAGGSWGPAARTPARPGTARARPPPAHRTHPLAPTHGPPPPPPPRPGRQAQGHGAGAAPRPAQAGPGPADTTRTPTANAVRRGARPPRERGTAPRVA
ncbi:hypothetical protein SBADM41S_10777 [Streptomyces badius]